MNLVLVGFSAAGKTSFGSKAAARLALPFYDTDAFLGDNQEAVRALHLEIGEEAFREREHGVLRALEDVEGALISTGGGLPLLPKNRLLLKQLGKVVYLQASFTALEERLKRREKPSFLKAWGELKKLYDTRLPLYKEVADNVLDTQSLTPEEIVDKLCALYD